MKNMRRVSSQVPGRSQYWLILTAQGTHLYKVAERSQKFKGILLQMVKKLNLIL